MSPNIKVSVTSIHISFGKKMVPDSCPIALALRDIKGIEYNSVTVGAHSCEFRRKGRYARFRLPKSAEIFLFKFDAGVNERHPMEPFEFELDLTEASKV